MLGRTKNWNSVYEAQQRDVETEAQRQYRLDLEAAEEAEDGER